MWQNSPPIGFINPTPYAAGSSAFNDITSGDNRCDRAHNALSSFFTWFFTHESAGHASTPSPCRCTADASICCSQGFYAAEGWDPVSHASYCHPVSSHSCQCHSIPPLTLVLVVHDKTGFGQHGPTTVFYRFKTHSLCADHRPGHRRLRQVRGASHGIDGIDADESTSMQRLSS